MNKTHFVLNLIWHNHMSHWLSDTEVMATSVNKGANNHTKHMYHKMIQTTFTEQGDFPHKLNM